MYEQQIIDVIEFEPGITTERVIDAVLGSQKSRGRSRVREEMRHLADDGWLRARRNFKAINWYKAMSGRP